MISDRFSFIAHGGKRVWNPISWAHLCSYVDELDLSTSASVLDIGCGRAALLIHIVEQYAAAGTGVDASRWAIDAAREAMTRSRLPGNLTLLEESWSGQRFEAEGFDVVICVGSTHVPGGYRATLSLTRRLLRPGGRLLAGEGYWIKPPPAEYLEFLGGSEEDEHKTHDDNQRIAEAAGFEVVRSSECSVEEWDDYEIGYSKNVEAYVVAHPEDPDAEAMLERIRPWHAGYLRWGRETMGFGVYLLGLGRSASTVST